MHDGTHGIDNNHPPGGIMFRADLHLAAGSDIEERMHLQVGPCWLGDIQYMFSPGVNRVMPENLACPTGRQGLLGHLSRYPL